MDQYRTWQKLAAEFLGTALLVFIGVGSVPATLMLNGQQPMTMADLGVISLAFGTAVIAVVYAFGHVSGAHINPAVTLGLAAVRQFAWKDVPGYLAAQVAGAIAGAAAIVGVLGQPAVKAGLGVASYAAPVGAGQAFFAEFIGTLVLVLTVIGAVHRKAPAGFAGLAIGFVVFAAIIPVGPVTGASINPARTVGPMIVEALAGGTVHWGQLPVYVLAECLAGVVATLVYGVVVATSRRGGTVEPAAPDGRRPTPAGTSA